MLCVVNHAAQLLKRQIESQGAEFLEKGGFTEKLYWARTREKLSDKSDRSGSPALSPLRKAHAAPHDPHRPKNRTAILGMPRPPGLPGHLVVRGLRLPAP